MIYTTYYNSAVGNILLATKNDKLIGLSVENQKYYLSNFKEELQEGDNDKILNKAKKWLDRYFGGEKPKINELEIEPVGSEFRKCVWKILCDIPYGKVITYNDIAKQIAKEEGIKKMSAQAVGRGSRTQCNLNYYSMSYRCRK